MECRSGWRRHSKQTTQKHNYNRKGCIENTNILRFVVCHFSYEKQAKEKKEKKPDRLVLRRQNLKGEHWPCRPDRLAQHLPSARVCCFPFNSVNFIFQLSTSIVRMFLLKNS